jgi:L-aspartate oxidase
MEQIADTFAGQPIIIGAGLAGLLTALYLAPAPVIVLAKAPLASGAASAWAQGGIAAALGADDDPALHAADSIAAGDGLCDATMVERIAAAAPGVVNDLARRGVAFDRGADGRFNLGLEAAHSRRRIVHAGGDCTGREILRALIKSARATPSITVLEGIEARRLIMADGRIVGVLAQTRAGQLLLPSSRVVIATGGVGGLYRYTTNPLGAIGQGLALAALAGAVLTDMEFVQFHPTALDVGLDPMPLVSEAVRGEGATLVDEAGERIMAGKGRGELESRDVVARAVWKHMSDGHRVFLDARKALGVHFAGRFPAITAYCRAAGVDPATMPIPVRPAAHYHMGGIAVNEAGRTSVEGLWACGETAATGLHGANRLASNSLLEAACCARWVAASVAGTTVCSRSSLRPTAMPEDIVDASPMRDIMSGYVGVLRDRVGLRAAIEVLRPLAFGDHASADPALVGLMIATAALLRKERRGGHYRTDFPGPAYLGSRLRLAVSEDDIASHFMPVNSTAIAVGA